jgi:hypothetical protein
MPIILVVAWHMALHLMQHGDWCTLLRPGRLACTAVPAPPYIRVLATSLDQLPWLFRHGYECTATIHHWWICAPNKIPVSR